MRKKYALIFLCFLFFSCQTTLDTVYKSVIKPFSPQKSTSQKIEQFLKDKFQDTQISFYLYNLDENLSFSKLNSEKLMVPASNVKLINLMIAYEQLGANYSPFMEIYKRGKILNEELQGDLVIKGNGAIFLGEHSFDKNIKAQQKLLLNRVKKVADSLKILGIKKIKGRIICDSTKWLHGLQNPFYNAAGANLFFENTLRLEINDKQLKNTPDIKKPFVVTKLTDKGKKQRRVHDNVIGVNLNKNSKDYWRLENYSSDDYFTRSLTSYLQKFNIEIDNETLTNEKKIPLEKVVTFQGSSIEQMAQSILTHSDNLKAELIFLYHKHKEVSDYNYSSEFVTKKANDLLLANTLLIKNGSGLSRQNRLSARHMITALRLIHKQDKFKPLASKLAIAGSTGTLKTKFLNTSWEKNFRGKTGTLDDVVCLSGYFISNKKAQQYALAILLNHIKPKKAWEKIHQLQAFIESLDI